MKKVVFTFGRMNPPTVGHQKLVDKVKAEAKKQSADARVYLSHTQNKKKDPLDYNSKVEYATKAFGSIVTKTNAKTIIQVLKELQSAGYTDVTLIVGSDRIPEFKKLLTKYNGKDYQFNSINFTSAGQRDPDAEGVAGMSASKMRALAMEGDLASFKSGLPKALQASAKEIYNKLRNIMEEEDKQLEEARMGPFMKKMNIQKGDTVEVNLTASGPIGNSGRYKLKVKEVGKQFITLELPNKRTAKFRIKDGSAVGVDAQIVGKINESTELEEASLTLQQRQKRSRLMKRLSKKIQRKAQIQKRRMADSKRLQKRALKKARAIVRKKVAGEKGSRYASLSSAEKISIDKMVDKKQPLIAKIAKKLLPKVRRAEMERLKKARGGSVNEERETLTLNELDNRKEPNLYRAMIAIDREKARDLKKFDRMRDQARIRDVIYRNRKVTKGANEEVVQDADIKDREGTQPAKYHSGLKKSTKATRDAQFKKGAEMSHKDPKAYPEKHAGDDTAKTRTSKHTKKYRDMFGEARKCTKEGGEAADFDMDPEDMAKRKSPPAPTYYQRGGAKTFKDLPRIKVQDENPPTGIIKAGYEVDGEYELTEDSKAALMKKADKSGIPYSILKKVYDRGMAAWRTGHRPGAGQEQWAYARVNSFITKGKGTWGGADKDLAAKVKKESFEIEEGTAKRYNQIKKAFAKLDRERRAPNSAAAKDAKRDMRGDQHLGTRIKRDSYDDDDWVILDKNNKPIGYRITTKNNYGKDQKPSVPAGRTAMQIGDAIRKGYIKEEFELGEALVNYNHKKQSWQVRNDNTYGLSHEKDKVILHKPTHHINKQAYSDGKRVYAHMKGKELNKEPDLSKHKKHPIKFVPDDRNHPFVHKHTGKPIKNAEYAVFNKTDAHVYTKEEVELEEGPIVMTRNNAMKTLVRIADDQVGKMNDKQLKSFAQMLGKTINKQATGKYVVEEDQLDEQIIATHYHAGAEKTAKGYRPHVTHKEKGHTMYSGGATYKSKEHAVGHAKAYVDAYAKGGDRHADRVVHNYKTQNQKHMVEEVQELGPEGKAKENKHKSTKKMLKDILPKSGAGQEGTDELVKTYLSQTPGMTIEEDYEVEIVEEAEGKTLNKPFRLPSGSKKKFGVYVKNEKGNTVKVTFGDPNLEIKRDNPERRKSFRARHDCANKKDKTTPGYWSCKQWRANSKVED